MDTDILITGAATLIRTTGTGTTDRTPMGTTVDRHFTGLTDTECITRAGIIVTTPLAVSKRRIVFSSWRFNIPPAYFFGDVDTAALMSMNLRAKVLEILFLNDPVAPAIAPGASPPFLAATHARFDAFPAGNAAQLVPLFPFQTQTRITQGRVHFGFHPRAYVRSRSRNTFRSSGPICIHARRSFEIFVDLPEASRSIDPADCS